MQSENRMFDDLVKMMNGVAGTMAGMGREAESSMRERMREWMAGNDFVGRDEFEAVKAMAAEAREENEILKARIAALEAKVAGPASGTKRSGKPASGNPGNPNPETSA
ncbi:MAG: accessory factor UbiK family protein [Pseudomonadota bacterium]|nr:accessory factor UbiK family protein [Pseudomonadota bacterium]